MNEPALPAEAFDANYQPDAGENAIYDKHAVDYGWSDNPGFVPTDKTWQDRWSQAFEFQRQQRVNTLSTPNYVASPQPVYALRWGQQRSTDGGYRDVQFWASLRDTDGSQESIWGQPCSSLIGNLSKRVLPDFLVIMQWLLEIGLVPKLAQQRAARKTITDARTAT